MKPLVLLNIALLFLALSFGASASGAQEASFQDTVEALQSRDDALALKLCEQLENAGTIGFGLFYNKGLAERNLGHFARSRASFEKALLYEPRNLEARRRLREVKEKLGPQVPELDVQGTPLWDKSEAQIAIGIVTLGTLLLGIRTRLSGKPAPLGQIGSLIAVLALLLALVYFNNPPSQRAVLVSEAAKLLAEPVGDSAGTATINGVMLEVLEQKSHLLKVRNRKGDTGWIREAEAVRL